MTNDNDIKIRLHRALDTWHEWPIEQFNRPRVIRELGGGLTNRSFLIACTVRDNKNSQTQEFKNNEAFYCIRLNNPSSSIIGINRCQEYKVLKALQSHRVSPSLVFANTDFTLFKFMNGRNWTQQDFVDTRKRTRLLELIDFYQSIKVDIPRIDYLQYIQNYFDRLKELDATRSKLIQAELDEFLIELNEFMLSDWRPVLCHHDVIPENIIETDLNTTTGLVLLDWEYAGLGHPDFDQRYAEHCSKNTMQLSPSSLQNGDTLDKLIYWLNTLWRYINIS